MKKTRPACCHRGQCAHATLRLRSHGALRPQVLFRAASHALARTSTDDREAASGVTSSVRHAPDMAS
eukprot:5053226-Alexandrium_andersonii.AAC.1